MSGRSFLDTNILIYTDDGSAPEKGAMALELLERLRLQNAGVLSTQVLQEYFSAATRKLGVSAERARRKVELFARFDLVQVDLALLLAAIDFHRLHQISIWDSLIVKAAQMANCRVLLTEDLQHGARFEGLEIVSPFV